MSFQSDKSMRNVLNTLLNMVRPGIVDSVNAKEGTIRVVFPDKDNSVIEDIRMNSDSFNMPKIGQQVLCLFDPIYNEGYCLGSFYSQDNSPPGNTPDVYIKKLDNDLIISYNKGTKALTIDTSNPITINGDLVVNGTVTSTP